MKPKVLVTRKFFPELVVRLQEYFEVDDHAGTERVDRGDRVGARRFGGATHVAQGLDVRRHLDEDGFARHAAHRGGD